MSCQKCKSSKTALIVWMGLMFYGVPKFLRYRLSSKRPFVTLFGIPIPGLTELQTPGCGCWVLTKDLYGAIKSVWRPYVHWYFERLPLARRMTAARREWEIRTRAQRRECQLKNRSKPPLKTPPCRATII